MKIVLDTSVYIDYLRSKKGLYIQVMQLGERASFYTPSVVVHELWSGESIKNPKVLREVKRSIFPTKIIELTRQLAEVSGELVRNNVVEETEDAIVAATALYLDAQLATSNRKHFESVPGLKLYNPQN